MGLSGLEPPTSRLSGVRSNRLSYKPRLMSKCADIWVYAGGGACTPEHKSLWMHMRRSRGMTGRRPGIPALANCKYWRSRRMTNRRFGIPALTVPLLFGLSSFLTRSILISLFSFQSGSHLLSHTVSSIVSSAAQVLTIVFGMRTGVSPGRIATGISFLTSFGPQL